MADSEPANVDVPHADAAAAFDAAADGLSKRFDEYARTSKYCLHASFAASTVVGLLLARRFARRVSHLPFLLKMIGIPTAFFTTSTVANWGLSLPVSRAFKYKCGTLVDEHASLLEEYVARTEPELLEAVREELHESRLERLQTLFEGFQEVYMQQLSSPYLPAFVLKDSQSLLRAVRLANMTSEAAAGAVLLREEGMRAE